MPFIELNCSSKGFLVNDTLIIKAKVAICDDPKKKTGYVGLKNQGSTSYMNSLLQTLFHLPYLRKAVYHLQTVESDIPSTNIICALQSLFYELQYSDNSVTTEDLTKSFGWNESETSMLQDAQEFNRVLCERLEEKMKGTAVEGTIQQLFGGHYLNYIECTNVNCNSARVETFYDLQLDVKGCKDVYASLDKYVCVERLEGDNRYRTEQAGLQDARKGLLFIDFPPVLQLHLKRFEYDSATDTTVKINDRFEFPLELDLDKENGKYLSPMADRSVRNLFTLHSVLVHSVGVHGGHYHAYIRPNLSDQWFNFDDEKVTKEDVKRALEDQYGGDEEQISQVNSGFDTTFRCTKWSNAYMLVYIRKSDVGKVICKVNQEEIAEDLLVRLKKGLEEKYIRKNFTILKVARTEDLIEQIGREIYFDLVDTKKVRHFCTEKSTLFYDFKDEVAKVFGIPVQFQRYWVWAKRHNQTSRPYRPLTFEEETLSVKHISSGLAEWTLFLEVERGMDLHLIQPPNLSNTDIMIFFKLYDPIKEELRYVGKLFVKISDTPSQIVTKLNVMAGFSPLQRIELYEEIKFEPSIMCEHIDKKLTFHASELENGDIICMQKSPLVKDLQKCRYPDVPSFFEHLRMRLNIEHEVKEMESDVDLYIDIKVASNNDLVKQIGIEIYFDLVDHDKVHCFRLKKWSPFNILKHKVAKEFGVPVQFQRYWLWAKRQNLSYRPFRYLTPGEESKSFGHYQVACHTELKLFLEIELGQDLYPIRPPIKSVDDILLFFKLYDPLKEQLCYVGRFFVNSYGKPLEILEKLKELAFFPSSQEIELYEEIRSEPSVMCDLIDKNSTFRASELGNGDIVCFQKSSSANNMPQYRFPNVPSYLHYVRNRQVVHFRSLRKRKVDAFTLELSKFSLYGEVVEKVACELGIHYPSKIRLTPHNSITRQPTQTPIVDRSVDLSAMLLNGNQSSDILYYDVLETSEAETSNRSTSCVICLDAPKESACIPCGHLSGCESCLKKIKDRNGGCPICRADIQEVVRIYTA